MKRLTRKEIRVKHYSAMHRILDEALKEWHSIGGIGEMFKDVEESDVDFIKALIQKDQNKYETLIMNAIGD